MEKTMSDTEVLPATQSGDDDLDLVALTPAHLAATQKHLISWCERKVVQLRGELKDLEEHLLIATANGWNLRGLQATITRTENRVTYYSKVRRAVEEGYLIVPNLPITLLAVRTAANTPRYAQADFIGSTRFNARAQLLPQGQGRYVDDRVVAVDNGHYDEKREKHVEHWVADSFDEPDFPYQLVKPAVIAATERAMRLKVFDEIGMVENAPVYGRRGDPIMVGRILDPRRDGRACTFFIAWWLNTGAL
jgi:hypothetical protein